MSTRRRMPPYRLWGSTKNGNVEFESLTKETLDGALKIIRDYFFRDESVSRSVELTSEAGATEELLALCQEVAKDGVSVVAIDVANGNVIGVAFNKIQVPTKPHEKEFYEDFRDNCKCKSSKALIDFMIDIDSRVDLFKHYNTDCILEVMFLATASEYRKQRIGELLIAASLEIGRELKNGRKAKTPIKFSDKSTIMNEDCVPSLCSAIATSIYTLKICLKLGFDQLIEVNFDNYEYNGHKFSERTGIHRTAVLIAKRLT